ncbi:MAG TPA: hypothetical protein VFO25_13930 [Candidatus Eremiobacteraceae bacterium]|nr:hypothetical protein [Candidatus Eremiobacteraceae bacterium]
MADWVRLFNIIVRMVVLSLMVGTLLEFLLVSVQAAKTSSTDVARADYQVFDSQPSPDSQSMGIAGGH